MTIMYAGRSQTRRWLVWCPDRAQAKEDGKRLIAKTAEDAAVEWAQWDDAQGADYSIVRGTDATVLVAEDRDDGAAPQECFVVSGESISVYRASVARA